MHENVTDIKELEEHLKSKNRIVFLSQTTANYEKYIEIANYLKILDIAELEGLLHAAEHVAQVVDIGAVGQHVRDLEDFAGFRVRIARHHHRELAPAHVVGLGLAAPDTLDAAGAVAQRDELLQELRMGVLDVIQVQHGVAAHLQRQIELLQLLA